MSKIIVFRLIIVSLISMLYELGFSQQASDSTILVPLDEITITATKSEINRSQIPLTLSVIGEKTITESAETAVLPVIGEQVPGIFVTERGVTGFGVATGAAGQVTIRGIGGSPSTQVLFLLNGNPQFMGLMGHPLADAYRVSNIERVEIIRGPASTLYGSNAMGGVINIITKDAERDGFSGKAGATYGSYNTIKYMASGGYKNNKIDIQMGVNHDQSDGHRPASYFKINDGYTRIGINLGENLNLNTDFSLAQFKSADPGYDTSEVTLPVAGDTIDITRGMGSISLDNKFKKLEGSVRLFYNFGEHTITNGFFSKDNSYGLILYETFHLTESFTLLSGVDYKIYGGEAENLKFNTLLIDTTVFELAGYINARKEIHKRLIINAGIRLDYNKIYGREYIPCLGANYRINSNSFIKSSLSKGYRSPTIRELYMFGTANENLISESLWNIETGVVKSFFNHKLNTEITVFYLKGKNLIQSVFKGSSYIYENSGEIRNTGLEFLANLRVSEMLNISANYSYINMKNELLATPKHKAYLGIVYRISEKATIHLSWQHINTLYTQLSPVIKIETYNLIDARISYQLNKNINFYLKTDNILNKSYETNYGYPMPGILVFGGFNISI